MAQVVSAESSPRVSTAANSFIEWGPIIAGALVAASLSFVFLTFGAAVGLSAVSPWQGSGISAKTAAALGVFWTLAQQIGAFLAGGYVAGRMRTRWADATQDEVDFRDGLHGALVWAIGIVIGAMLLASAAAAIARTGAEAGTRVLASAASSATAPGGAIDIMAGQVDVLLRPNTIAPAPAGAAPRDTSDPREELKRVFARSIANGSLSDPDKAYLARVVAQRTGLPPQEAEKRVTDTFAEASRLIKETTDKTRKAAVVTGFVTATSLLISLAAAWWAALRGGNHRDNRLSPRLFARPPYQRRVSTSG